jgi:hypothetical protein
MSDSIKDSNFSKLFLEHVPQGYDLNVGGERYTYAFEFLNDLEKSFKQVDFHRFKESFESFNELKTRQQEALGRFEFEYGLVIKDRAGYVNGTVKRLIVLHKNLGFNKTDNQFINQAILLSQILVKDCLSNIFTNHHLELKETNRAYLANWYYLKEPIRSFKFISYPEERRFEELFKKYLRGKFISYETTFATFRTLFKNKRLVNKIDWVGNKSSLYLFIKLLRENHVIKDTKNKHWNIVSEFFLLDGESVDPKDFTNQKEPKTKATREPLEKFAKALSYHS